MRYSFQRPEQAEGEVRAHVARPPLPWRRAQLTECGIAIDPSKRYPIISREDLAARLKQHGQQRTMMITCMTCYETARRWATWEEDPVSCINRETEKAGRWGSTYADSRRAKAHEQLTRELTAIAMLIERHRAEFDELIEDQAAIVPIAGKGPQ